MDATWISILVTLALALLGTLAGIHHSLSRRIDELAEKNDQRISRMEARLERNTTKIEQLNDEVVSLRKRWHDLRETTMKEAHKMWGEWKDDVLDRLAHWKDEVLDKIRDRRDRS